MSSSFTRSPLPTGEGSGERPHFTSPSSIRFLVIHCTATRYDRDYTVEQLERDHRLRGFDGIGYHFYIRKDGTLTQCRPLEKVGAHAKPYNHCSLGIAYEGGLDDNGKPADTRTRAQVDRLKSLLVELKRLFPDAQILGHRDLRSATPKECPCFDAAWEYRHL